MSFADAVQLISDQLTEGVSKFTLFVIKKKNANAKIPSALKNNVNVVGTQCNNLVDLANQISLSFEEFPTIKAEIQSESNGLSSASENLIMTSNNMSEASKQDLSDSWEMLSNACSTISTKVIALLNILHKAEVERIKIQVERTCESVDKSNIHSCEDIQDDNKYQAYLDDAQQTAYEVNQLGVFLLIKSENQDESPYMKQILNEAAATLTQNANDMINKCQDCANNPEDESMLVEYKQLNTDSKQVALDVLEKILTEENFKNKNNEIIIIEEEQETIIISAEKKEKRKSLNANNNNNNNNNNNQRGRGGRGRGVRGGRGGRGNKIKNLQGNQNRASWSPNKNKQDSAQPIPKNWNPQNLGEIADVARSVADDGQGKSWMGGCDELSIEIQKMAQAAQEGKGADLLAAARNIAAITSKFVDETKEYSGTVKNLRSQHKLYQCSNLLRDNCRQLKILASVKASIAEEDNLDKDDQLIMLTSSLLKLWKETSDTIAVSKLLKR
eukprot:TRINITY_DN3635_c0_g2_i2.p1 TRINITY_DN3635_c0_g2~~TRINITY_DN3635_c0_g2_i2.p1  ORF type:complete len:501 (+),score=191.13 TRINITY_DN3635_c0_g2_i2:56-1558(+)